MRIRLTLIDAVLSNFKGGRHQIPLKTHRSYNFCCMCNATISSLQKRYIKPGLYQGVTRTRKLTRLQHNSDLVVAQS